MAKRKAPKKKSVPRKRKGAKSIRAKKGVRVTLKKYPKRPKASASTESMDKYLKKIREIDSENARRVSLATSITKVLGKR